jgi:transcriptional regulator with XRE-family HTH domain
MVADQSPVSGGWQAALMDPVRLGLLLRALRRRRGWTQVRLAAEARVSRSTVQLVERGGSDDLTGGTLRRVAGALGARFDQRLLWQGEALDRLLDHDHARLVEHVVRWLRGTGWDVVPEVTFAVRGERGSIDVLGWHPARRTLVTVEVKTVVPDMQGLLAGLDRKARLSPLIARERGWVGVSTTGRVLVLPADRTARRRVVEHGATLAAALPARTVAVRRWIREPHGPIAGIMFVSDAGVMSNRHRVAGPPRASRAEANT